MVRVFPLVISNSTSSFAASIVISVISVFIETDCNAILELGSRIISSSNILSNFPSSVVVVNRTSFIYIIYKYFIYFVKQNVLNNMYYKT